MTAPFSIFKAFEADDIVVANAAEVTTGLWSGDTGSLNTMFISSNQVYSSSTGDYFVDVYNNSTIDDPDDAEVQFSIAYGHIDGGGYPSLTQDDLSMEPTKATYCQYRNILLDPTDTMFTFTNANGSFNSSDIYVINIKRSRLREKLDPGNWYLPLIGSFTTLSPGGHITLIDDSGQSLGADHGKAGRIFNIISGALGGPDGFVTASAAQQSTSGSYGMVYPDLGIIVLNPTALTQALGNFIAPNTMSIQDTYPRNYLKLYDAMKHGYNSASADFQARSAETISSTHYFVRLRNKEFNYSNNPTFFNPTNGTLIDRDFIQNPQVYITSVGLYNNSNECVAIGKVSSPLPKSFSKEVLIRVRLDF